MMKCDCKDYNQCIRCINYDECDDKPYNKKFSAWILVYMIAVIIGILIVVIN